MVENKSGLVYKISGKDVVANCPEPILSNIDVVPYNREMDPQIAVEAIVEGYFVLITDYYSSGLAVLAALKRFLKSSHKNQSFKGQRDFRSQYYKLSQQIMLVIRNNKLVVDKAPDIGWLNIFYPDLDEFLLPFPQVQGLNSSWQWYEKGILIPVLEMKIHPWFGTYFPTRFEHLALFDHWLKHYKGEKESAIDVGVGSGVLTLQMLKYGFKNVLGTDSNPNSIVGFHEDLKRKKLNSKVKLKHGDLFAKSRLKSELIVFNPPWLPASYSAEGLDSAIYYDEDLFPHFFTETLKHLEENGRVIILFSNLAQITKLGEHHPIEEELANNRRFQKEYFVRKKVRPASHKTRRNQKWRDSEMVELWVLKVLKNQ